MMKHSTANGTVVGKGQVRVCPKHGLIIVAGPHAKPITRDTLAELPSPKARPVSVTVSPIDTQKGSAVQPGKVLSLTTQSLESKPKNTSDVSSSTYRAFACVDDTTCTQERDPPVIVCHDTPIIYSEVEGGRHCIPQRPISEDLSAPWIRKPTAVKLGSVSAPSSPINAVKLQRVSPQRARIFPPEVSVPIQKPVPMRQAVRIADPKTKTESDAINMCTEDPWVKGPQLKPVTTVNEILAMESNVDGYVAKKS